MTHRMKSLFQKRSQPKGLILLIVLGMLALFTLLAVTYVVSAGSSKTGSVAMRTRAIHSNVTVAGMTDGVAKSLLRGTNDQTTAFHAAGNLIGDIFGPNPIRTRFGHDSVPSLAVQPDPDWCRLLATPVNTPAKLVKISLVKTGTINGPLSDFENEYNSRIMTILEGPLNGHSFRILKYVGYVRDGSKLDENLAPPATPVTPDANTIVLPWAKPDYVDGGYYKIDYSIMIDLNDVWNESVTGQYFDNADNRIKTVSMPVNEWVSKLGVSSLFYFFRNSSAYQGYSMMINDTAFSNAGIGLTDRVVSGFGGLDSRELMAIPTSRPKIPPAFLPHYDYLQSPLMTTPISGIGVTQRTSAGEFLLNGYSNEGYDVADWHDIWLSHIDHSISNIIPSYHRPEMVNYIANLFGDPASMDATDVAELLRLIDASSARILSYQFGTTMSNVGFRSNDMTYPRLQNLSWSSPPTAAEVARLQSFVASQINGPWDVDNDGDTIKESILMNPGLPTVYSPGGKLLRPLAAIHIVDLDSRINVNAAGDRVQGLASYDVAAPDALFKTKASSPGQHSISQGMGVGPADISLTSVLYDPLSGPQPLLQTSTSSFSFFDERYGSGRYKKRPVNLADLSLDRVPGKRMSALPANDIVSQVFEREIHLPFSHGSLPGLPLARRSSIGMDVDRQGNLAMVQVQGTDVDTYNPLTVQSPSETEDDGYDAKVTAQANSDAPFGLDELQTILLRYQGDASLMPQRLKERLSQLTGYNSSSSINQFITTRSAELRYPNLIAAAKTTAPFDTSIETIAPQAASMQRWIKLVHAQKYQVRTLPSPAASDDPDLTYRAIEELFPVDFAKGLRMDLNRPFGNGFDDDGDGQVDEPQEIGMIVESDRYIDENGNLISAPGAYRRDLQETMGAQSAGTRIRLGARQILARNLYCLAQLIVPRDFQFPGMPSRATNLANSKIRAAAIAQWAANVVDFRDADAAMTRFEYDIFPFGCGTTNGLTARPAYWAPDHLSETVNGVANKEYVGVVWGMESPELLLTESFGLHDIKIRDTDLDPAGKLYDPMDSTKDQDFDQYRFPMASLFLELYCPRTTNTVNSTDAASQLAANLLLPGAPSSLYTTDGTNHVSLDLGRMAPAPSPDPNSWGQQPVWRIAITEFDKTKNPNTSLAAGQMANITNHASTNAAIDGSSWTTSPNPVSPDEVAGNGLNYDLSNPASRNPYVFDRFVWFANVRPGASQKIPDIKASLSTYGRNVVYYNRNNGSPLLRGGSYAVVGPRSDTPFGSATYNQYTNAPWTAILKRGDMSVPANKPIYSPSFQRISFANSKVTTFTINDKEANAPWMSRIKTPLPLICATDEPDDPALSAGSDWDECFPNGVGLNISFPAPIFGNSIWDAPYRPGVRLNTDDLRSSRSDNTYGFGDTQTPPDSWIDVKPAVPTGSLPNHPFDMKEDPAAPAILNTELRKLGLDDPRGSHENIRAAYLQRLADPELAYDPISNPYITVDWISLDLHVFNGEAPATSSPTYKLQSRYKDGKYAQGAAFTSDDGSVNGFSYHSPSTPDLQPTVVQADPTTLKHRSYFKQQLGYRNTITWSGDLGNCGTTLGYINAGFYKAANTVLTAAEMDVTTGATDLTGMVTVTGKLDGFGPPVTQYMVKTSNLPLPNGTYTLNNVSDAVWGAPRNISSVTWFNRPFASPSELMLVPATNAGQFGLYHSAFSGSQRSPFTYLPSFQASNPSNTVEPNIPAGESPTRSYWLSQTTTPSAQADFSLLMDLVETQPPFADANTVLRPDTMLATVLAGDAVSQRFLSSFVAAGAYGTNGDTARGPTVLAPFNLIPNYVAVGKININNIALDSAGNCAPLKAIENNYLDASSRTAQQDPLQAAFMSSRRGYALPSAGSGDSLFFTDHPSGTTSYGRIANSQMNAHYPTQFAGAYRPSTSANLAPPVANAAANDKIRGKFGVETTLARSTDVSGVSDAQMLFSPTDLTSGGNRMTQNAFPRMQRMMRLQNLVTNQSNVFAVWITVSLYEYDPITGFGNEFLDETGQPKREKSFYIIDRSVPVGFKPGEDLNTEKTILLKRKLD